MAMTLLLNPPFDFFIVLRILVCGLGDGGKSAHMVYG